MAVAKMINGRRYLLRGKHRKRELAEQTANKVRKHGRSVLILERSGMYYVWATSMFERVK